MINLNLILFILFKLFFNNQVIYNYSEFLNYKFIDNKNFIL